MTLYITIDKTMYVMLHLLSVTSIIIIIKVVISNVIISIFILIFIIISEHAYGIN
jgi:hypothetical protein